MKWIGIDGSYRGCRLPFMQIYFNGSIYVNPSKKFVDPPRVIPSGQSNNGFCRKAYIYISIHSSISVSTSTPIPTYISTTTSISSSLYIPVSIPISIPTSTPIHLCLYLCDIYTYNFISFSISIPLYICVCPQTDPKTCNFCGFNSFRHSFQIVSFDFLLSYRHEKWFSMLKNQIQWNLYITALY